MNKIKINRKGFFIAIIVSAILWLCSKGLLCVPHIADNVSLEKILNIFIDLPGILSSLFIPFAIVIFSDQYKNLTEEKWYSEKIDISLMEKDKIPLSNFELEIMDNLSKNTNTKEFVYPDAKSKYFDCVYQLQNTDAEFNLIWNNFNYFTQKNKPELAGYWRIIVYRRIIDTFYKKN